MKPINNTEDEWIHCVEDESFVIFSFVMLAIIFFPTVFGNLLIIASIAKFRHLRSNMHILIGNLAVSDLIIGLSIVLHVTRYFHGTLMTNKYYCLGQNALFVISLGTSSFNMLVISIERFLAVRFPLRHKTMFTRKTTYILMIICWSYHSVVAVLPLIGWNDFHDGVTVCDTDLVWEKMYDIILFVGLFVVVVANGIICGYTMKIVLVSNKLIRYESSDSFHSRNRLTNLRRTKMTLVIFGVFAVCWAPYLIISLVLVFTMNPTIRCVRLWCICSGVVNSAVNWLIYGLANRSFRDAFKDVIYCRKMTQISVSVRRAQYS